MFLELCWALILTAVQWRHVPVLVSFFYIRKLSLSNFSKDSELMCEAEVKPGDS